MCKKYYLYKDKLAAALQPIPVSDILDKYVKTEEGKRYSTLKTSEGYTSIFNFDLSILSCGDVRHYTGPVNVEYFIVQFDADKNTNVKDMTKIMMRFFKDISKFPVKIFYSGNKGYHIYIPKSIVKYDSEYEGQMNVVQALIDKKLGVLYPECSKFITTSSKLDSVIRMPFTINTNSSKIKRMFNVDTNKPLDKALSVADCNDLEISRILLDSAVIHEDIFIDVINTLGEHTDVEINYNEHYPYTRNSEYCVIKMINDKSTTGSNIYQYGSRIYEYFNRIMPESFAQFHLREWRKSLNKSYDPESPTLQNIYDNYGKANNVYICDKVKRGMDACSKCPYNSTKELTTSSGKKLDNLEMVKALFFDKSIRKIDLSDIYSGFNSYIVPELGELALIAASSSGGKTLFVQNLTYSMNEPVLFITWDDGSMMLTKRYADMTDKNLSDEGEYAEFKSVMQRIKIVDGQYMEDIEDMVNSAERFDGVEYKHVVLDFAQVIPSRSHASQNEYARINNLSMIMKRLSNKYKKTFYLLSQVPKGETNNAQGLLTNMYAAKGSGSLVEAATKAWNISRPNRMSEEDNIMHLFVGKDKLGSAGYVVEFNVVPAEYKVMSSGKPHFYPSKDAGENDTAVLKMQYYKAMIGLADDVRVMSNTQRLEAMDVLVGKLSKAADSIWTVNTGEIPYEE